jgi:hypothetical protein
MGPGLEIPVEKARKAAQENAADGHVFVWEAPGLGEAGTWTPVAMAAIVRELSNAMSISKVYTPPEYVLWAVHGGVVSIWGLRWSKWVRNGGRCVLL